MGAMSDSSADQQEPSMEEILASIRRIISEDGEEIADGESAEPSAEGEEAVFAEPEAKPAEELVEDVDDDILELTDAIEDEPEPEPEPDPEPEPETDFEPEPEAPEDDEKLVSDAVEEASVATMAGLTAALSSTARVGDGDKTLEELVRELLRPVLKDWLDANLTDIVERIVREEVERIADRVKK